MMKRQFFIVMMILSFVLCGCRQAWIDSDEQLLEYINEHCPVPQGQISSLTYLESGEAGAEYGDGYLKYLASFSDGSRSLIQVNVSFHRHLLQKGPDYRIRSCHAITVTEIKTASFRYTDAANDCIVLIDSDGTFLLRESPELNYYLNGSWTCDGQTMILNCDERCLYFLIDENLMVYLDGPSDHFLMASLPDCCVFMKIK